MNAEVLKNIENGVLSIKKTKIVEIKIWDVFRQMEKDNASVFEGIVICDKCNNILKYNATNAMPRGILISP